MADHVPSRRIFADLSARALVPLLAAALVAMAPGGCRESPALPDVVVIVIDTLRADRLPFHGGPAETAPFLDQLASQSLVFDNAFSTSSWTAPATASIFTGLYPNQHGVVQGLVVGLDLQAAREGYSLNRIPDDLATLPVAMKELGYRTFGASANPNVDTRLGFERGFDHFIPFDPASGKSADHLTRKVLAWRDELRGDGPFFLYVHFADPHGPYRRHAEWVRNDVPRPRNALDDMAAYDSEIRFTDEHIRRLLDGIQAGRRRIVIVTADHGQEFLDHGHRGHGFQLYSELTRVPLLIHDPARPELRGRVSGVVSNADILPTLRELLLGVPQPGSLLDSDRSGLGSRQAFSMRTRVTKDGSLTLRSVVAGRYKLITRSDGAPPELYDLLEDPDEQHDLAGLRPDVAARLAEALEAQRMASPAGAREATTRWSPSPEMVEALQELGYVEGADDPAPR
jgi:arylsulfatase A-like enzyme